MDFSFAEENYLKAIYHLSQAQEVVTTNAIAEELNTSAASVTDMLKKLANKDMIVHVKYRGVTMTSDGSKKALWIIRKHRLWEVFLVEKLKFNWDEVHEVAEQLEHIRSKVMIERLDQFLGFPKFDPHGDPIPDQDGNLPVAHAFPLCTANLHETLRVIAVKDTRTSFLKYLDKLGIGIGAQLQVLERIEFDSSMEVEIDGKTKAVISHQVSANIMVG